MNPWADFAAVIFVQLLAFLFLAYKKQAFKRVTLSLIAKSAVLGVVFGIVFDLAIGKYLGVFDYALHFGVLFLIINGGLSYGLWILTIQLLQNERFLAFCGWTIAIGLVYEIANYFFTVWIWTFDGSFLYREAVVIFAAYCGLAILAALASTISTKMRYRAFRIRS